jgi:hypothetical protein
MHAGAGSANLHIFAAHVDSESRVVPSVRDDESVTTFAEASAANLFY